MLPMLPLVKSNPAPSTKFCPLSVKTACPSIRSAVVSPVAAGSVVTKTKVVSRTNRSEGSRNHLDKTVDFPNIRKALQEQNCVTIQRTKTCYQSEKTKISSQK